MIRKCFSAFLLFLLCALPLSAGIRLVEEGRPAAVIVIPENATLNERFTAGQLAYWISEITGCRPDIVRTPSASLNNVFIGRSYAEKKFGDDLAFLKDSDGFAVRTEGNSLYLFGAEGSGNLFAVYDLLEKNTDIIWPTMVKDADRVFTPLRTLEITKADYREKPAFRSRSWGINNGLMYNHPRTEYFTARLKTDGLHGEAAQRKTFGFDDDDYTGHNLWRYLPWKRYKDTHPEYFCEVDGKRIEPGYHANLCFSAPGCAEEFARNFMEDRLAHGPDGRIAGIGLEDTDSKCFCKLCTAPITLPDGRVLDLKTDPELFRTTQYYLWLNRVAREVRKNYPDKKIATLAYVFASAVPAVPVEDNIIINYCPIGKNLKADFSDPGNKTVREQLEGWAKASPGPLSVYEYYGCAADYPRPVSYVVQRDLKFMREHNVFRVYSEWIHKNNAEYLSAMEFWVVCKLLWDPGLDIEKLRTEYLEKTFRAAAPDMKRFYDIVRDTWYADGASSFYFDNAVNLTGYYLLKDEETEKACFDALRSAVEKADHPVSRLLARKILAAVESYAGEFRKRNRRTGPVGIPRITDETLDTMEGIAWSGAAVFGPEKFGNLMNPPEKKNLLVNKRWVRIAHDGKDLILKFHADGVSFPCKNQFAERMWSKEHWEIFLQTDRGNPAVPYYHFAFDTEGVKYNAIGFGAAWNMDWKVVTRKNRDSWDAIVRIPLAGLNVQKDRFTIHFLQYSVGAHEYATLFGNQPHEPAAMTPVVLESGK